VHQRGAAGVSRYDRMTTGRAYRTNSKKSYMNLTCLMTFSSLSLSHALATN
jgi:hypothetical protein